MTRALIQFPDGAAHVVISLDATGAAHVRSYCHERLDSAVLVQDECRLLRFDIPFLLAELRLQLAQGRPATTAESAEIAALHSVVVNTPACLAGQGD